jgi:hypothetical protein
MGFDGLFFGRADYQDFQDRHDTKRMEMIWKGSGNLGKYKHCKFNWSFGDRVEPIFSDMMVI